MLILIGVTINVAIQGELFKTAREASINYEIEQEKEQIELGYQEYQMQKTNRTQNPELEIAGATVEGDEINGWEIRFERTKHEYTLNGDGSIDIGLADKWDGISKEIAQITEEGNWHIYNSAQMKYFADFVNGKLTEEEKGQNIITEDTVVYLEADIDLGARANEEGKKVIGTEWIPIGMDTSHVFVGTFEGNNHYIKGVYVQIDGNFGGLFGNSNSIQNLTIKNSYIEAANGSGAIVGALRKGTIDNCHNSNTVVVVSDDEAGGIAGQIGGNSDTKIVNCTNTGDIEGNMRVGGVVGCALENSIIVGCSNNGTIVGRQGSKGIGGIAGYLYKSNISNCGNNGGVSCTGQYAGGVVGLASSSSKTSGCYNAGDIMAATGNAGGCIGVLYGTIDACCNVGTIETGGCAGGIVGQIGADCTANITNCYNLGRVGPKGDQAVDSIGGIVGYVSRTNTSGTIENNYNSGSVKGVSKVGGIIGRNVSTFIVKNCYTKGMVEGKGTNIGAVIGEQSPNANNVSKIYYFNTITLSAIGNMEAPETVESTQDELNSFEEFLDWIQEKSK